MGGHSTFRRASWRAALTTTGHSFIRPQSSPHLRGGLTGLSCGASGANRCLVTECSPLPERIVSEVAWHRWLRQLTAAPLKLPVSCLAPSLLCWVVMTTQHRLMSFYACAFLASCSGQVSSDGTGPGTGGSGTDAAVRGTGGGQPGGGASSGGSGAAAGAGGTGTGGSSGTCSVDADCAPALCGKCPDGSTACPTTRCVNGLGGPGYCASTPAQCSECAVDADCPLPTCTVCIDGSTTCTSQKCSNGSCGGQTVSVCANRSGPACTNASQCPAPVCRTCPGGTQVCTDTGFTDCRCFADSVKCPQCKADGDCGKPTCSVCYDGSTSCGTVSCEQGQCASTSPKCPERPTGRPLQWYSTCGWPSCPGFVPDAGARDASVSCAAERTPCTQRGATCGNPASNCGATLVCEDHDPKQSGCPISSAKFKSDIRYLEPGDLERVRDETLKFRLANYRYRPEFTNDPDAEHLGFIIEDNPRSPAVYQGHDRVDLYGYMSMVVATLQVQQKEIQSLRKQLGKLQAGRGKEKGK